MKNKIKPSTLLSGLALGLGLFQAQAADMESVYNKYLQGDYLNAQAELELIIQSNPSTEELFQNERSSWYASRFGAQPKSILTRADANLQLGLMAAFSI